MTDLTSDDSSPSRLTQLWKDLRHLLHRNGNGQNIQDFVEQHMGDEEEVAEGLTTHEKRLIKASLAFDKITAADVAVSRSDIVHVSLKKDFQDIWKVFLEHRHSRLLVTGDDLDSVQGFMTLKDMVEYVSKPASFKMKKVVRSCTFVPETLALPEVLQHLRRDKVAIAVVTDEYGGTAGLVTLKDILEKLVGNIDDEHDEEEAPLIVPLEGGKYRLDPKLELAQLATKVPLKLPEDMDETDVETVGGLVLWLAGRVPLKGERFPLADMVFTVNASDGRRVTQVTLETDQNGIAA